MAMDERPKFLVTTTQRCGATWVAAICRAITDQGKPAGYVPGLDCGLMDFGDWDADPAGKIRQFSRLFRAPKHRGKAVFKTHDLPPALVGEFLEQNPNFHVVNVVRDFRDVLVSRVMYNRHHLPSNGRRIESRFVRNHPDLSDDELIKRFFGSREMLQWFVNWKIFAAAVPHERYIRLRYESLLTEKGLHEAISSLYVAHHATGPPDASQVSKIEAATRFRDTAAEGSGRRIRREVKSNFFRKGIAGDYRRFFGKRESEFLRILMDGEYA